MKNYFLPFLILFFLFSCKKSPEVHFKKNGYSFTCPKGWSISKESQGSQGRALMITKDGYIWTPYVIIIDWDKNIDIDELTNFHRNEIENNTIYKFMDVSLSNTYDDKYNKINTKSFEFTTSLGNAKTYGKFYIFHNKGKTFAISEYKNHEKEVLGFKKIEQTLKN